jgi:hypothetical protein
MVALADWQITKPARGITGLADIQQPGTGDSCGGYCAAPA